MVTPPILVDEGGLPEVREEKTHFTRAGFLLIPSVLLFLFFFIIPVFLLLILGFNPNVLGVLKFQQVLTLENFTHFFGESMYWTGLMNTLLVGFGTAFIALVLGFPIAYVIGRSRNPGRNTFYMILVLIPLQLDIVVRTYGMMVLLGDNGLINGTLIQYGWLGSPMPLMYNHLGVFLGLAQLTLPFMILSLVGVIQAIDESVILAARSLGAGQWRAMSSVVVPLTLPGIFAGTLLVFAITISAYVVPVLMGGWKVQVLPIFIYQQIAELGYWQFGSAIAVVLFVISMVAVIGYNRMTRRYVVGGQL